MKTLRTFAISIGAVALMLAVVKTAPAGLITTVGGPTWNPIITLTSSDNNTATGTWFVPAGVTSVKVLVVGGGGGGTYDRAAGGGAGGLLYYGDETPTNGHAEGTSFSVTPGSLLSVQVGGGGAGATVYGITNNGGDSVFGTLTALGGGGGGLIFATAPSGGSGGGAYGQGGIPGAGTPGQGFAGGTAGNAPNYGSGGGGGAGGAGGNAALGLSGNGGIGLQYSISGTAAYYAGGGGGAWTNLGAAAGTGGLGGGGNGGATAGAAGLAGTPGTGGGGGAGANAPQGPGGAGGSGIVIVSYVVPSTLILGKTDLLTDTPGAPQGDTGSGAAMYVDGFWQPNTYTVPAIPDGFSGVLTEMTIRNDSDFDQETAELLVLRPTGGTNEFEVIHRVTVGPDDVPASDSGTTTYPLAGLLVQEGDVLSHYHPSGAGTEPIPFSMGYPGDVQVNVSYPVGVGDILTFAPYSQPREYFYNVRLQFVPEPTSLVLAALGLLGLVCCGWRRRK